LVACGAKKGGITFRNISKQPDLILLELQFVSTPRGQNITIKDATYSEGTAIDGKKFESGTIIEDGGIIYEHIRVDPEKSFSASITFLEVGVGRASLSLEPSAKRKKPSDTPIGAIVASILHYESFLMVNGLNKEQDINKVIWVPCDGQDIGTEEGNYGAFSGGKAPDLRGVFLRGVNDMKVYGPSIPQAKKEQLNPDPKEAGQFQPDAFQDHAHPSNAHHDVYGAAGAAVAKGAWSDGRTNNASSLTGKNSQSGRDHGGNSAKETRPKNISVYYYIKIR